MRTDLSETMQQSQQHIDSWITFNESKLQETYQHFYQLVQAEEIWDETHLPFYYAVLANINASLNALNIVRESLEKFNKTVDITNSNLISWDSYNSEID